MKVLKNYQKMLKEKACAHVFTILSGTSYEELKQCKKCFRQIENRFYE
jgi:hypothetical protein